MQGSCRRFKISKNMGCLRGRLEQILQQMHRDLFGKAVGTERKGQMVLSTGREQRSLSFHGSGKMSRPVGLGEGNCKENGSEGMCVPREMSTLDCRAWR